MRALPTILLSFVALATSLPNSLDKRQIRVTKVKDSIVENHENLERAITYAKQDNSKAKPWSYQQILGTTKLQDGSAYVDCRKDNTALSGCPAEFPWNQEGCFAWAAERGTKWRRCNKRQSGKAYWDAGSSLFRIYESPPVMKNANFWEKLMVGPIKLGILDQLRS